MPWPTETWCVELGIGENGNNKTRTGGHGNDNRYSRTALALTFCGPTNQILIGWATERQCQSCAKMTIIVPIPSRSRFYSHSHQFPVQHVIGILIFPPFLFLFPIVSISLAIKSYIQSTRKPRNAHIVSCIRNKIITLHQQYYSASFFIVITIIVDCQ